MDENFIMDSGRQRERSEEKRKERIDNFKVCKSRQE